MARREARHAEVKPMAKLRPAVRKTPQRPPKTEAETLLDLQGSVDELRVKLGQTEQDAEQELCMIARLAADLGSEPPVRSPETRVDSSLVELAAQLQFMQRGGEA